MNFKLKYLSIQSEKKLINYVCENRLYVNNLKFM